MSRICCKGCYTVPCQKCYEQLCPTSGHGELYVYQTDRRYLEVCWQCYKALQADDLKQSMDELKEKEKVTSQWNRNFLKLFDALCRDPKIRDRVLRIVRNIFPWDHADELEDRAHEYQSNATNKNILKSKWDIYTMEHTLEWSILLRDPGHVLEHDHILYLMRHCGQ